MRTATLSVIPETMLKLVAQSVCWIIPFSPAQGAHSGAGQGRRAMGAKFEIVRSGASCLLV
jgi:hypothetical protein